EILEFAFEQSWSRYPPFTPDDLHARLAEYTGWTSDGVIVGNGSNEIIQALLSVLVRPGGTMVIPSPTFTLYKLIGSVQGAEVREVPLNSDYTFDCDAIERVFLGEGDMLVICSPNNPTGTLFPRERLIRLLEQTDAPVIMDEAYFEFSKVTAADLLGKYENLVILRTFSKAFSLAGLRVGYGLMNPGLLKEVEKAKLPYNINFISIAASMKLLENCERLAESIEILIAERERMLPELNEIDGVTAYTSRANFILIETPYIPMRIFQGVLDDGFLIRDVSNYPMLGHALRISVSTPDDNDRFLGSLRRVMAELNGEA
ncbi:histidinol-phosphate transaminase, partial [Candidatus Latescibacterota bacterium]